MSRKDNLRPSFSLRWFIWTLPSPISCFYLLHSPTQSMYELKGSLQNVKPLFCDKCQTSSDPPPSCDKKPPTFFHQINTFWEVLKWDWEGVWRSETPLNLSHHPLTKICETWEGYKGPKRKVNDLFLRSPCISPFSLNFFLLLYP